MGATAGVAGGATDNLGRTAGSAVNTSTGVAGSAAGNAGGSLGATAN